MKDELTKRPVVPGLREARWEIPDAGAVAGICAKPDQGRGQGMADEALIDSQLVAALRLWERMLLRAVEHQEGLSPEERHRVNQVPIESALHQLTAVMGSMPADLSRDFLVSVQALLQEKGVTPIGQGLADVVEMVPSLRLTQARQ